jgi:peptide-methionine (S)-S-oxide reductase
MTLYKFCLMIAAALFPPLAVGCGSTAKAQPMQQAPAPAEDIAMEGNGEMEKAIFGAGCFWGVEAAFRQVKGVVATSVGYSGGTVENPTYQQVCTDMTGHAEVVQVEYDPNRVTYEQLLQAFWKCHNPTTLNRQGPDVGAQYRSAIFYLNEEQKNAAIASKQKLEQSGAYKRPIVTEITPAGAFYKAEEYHQQYLEKRGLATCILP